MKQRVAAVVVDTVVATFFFFNQTIYPNYCLFMSFLHCDIAIYSSNCFTVPITLDGYRYNLIEKSLSL